MFEFYAKYQNSATSFSSCACTVGATLRSGVRRWGTYGGPGQTPCKMRTAIMREMALLTAVRKPFSDGWESVLSSVDRTNEPRFQGRQVQSMLRPA